MRPPCAHGSCARRAAPNNKQCIRHRDESREQVRLCVARKRKLMEDLAMWPNPADWPDRNQADVRRRYRR